MKKITLIASAVLALSLTACGKSKVIINGAADLEGKKIGVQAGTTGEMWVNDNVKEKEVLPFKTGIDAALSLKAGGLDAVVLDELPAKEIVSRHPELMIIRDKVFSDNKEEYAIAVKKGNKDLLNSINNTIETMKANGDYDKLIQAFMPADGNIKVPESIFINSTKSIKLGTNAQFPPFEYIPEKDVVGFDISMGENIAKNYGAKLQVIDMSFESLINALDSGIIDFIAAGMSVTEERKKNVDFSVPYYQSEQVIIIRK
ncbi:MAG: transporter substrate-binding domain-containing protein [Treponema sp.]|uniref:transporter substrate-binding domain-containing protein n=1 Tax=Treponema sp. TaxID=166 RepID=UPI00298DC93D|nr:transporter substrate-binding domain-containing protein [Treponema sp.]MBR5932693.1 transporter substrate-binding domain-containing protein [Treponema sp.]